ncbi:farnesyl cysteine carboxyl-methyltransferase [Chlorogloeopsis fritschii PCC 6912]|uniref:Farnesyl cysteine carboxyl-methyltransferase n=3 Tax=Chlorogloeopsis fritschii TaxID=1124 RepID=A0A3S0ZWC0_CHLFR|nr:protein-S-isoprenylcysteine O-methyltransferase [Chlorogloeopsis fritschii]RUR79190.1 farnesyl cysteine carboxyl-methyltransferase [Chlorogloeopsis fritschii PCC 6912]
MNPLTSKIIFIIGMILWLLVRIPYQKEQKKNTIVDDRKTIQEKLVRLLLLIGILFLPLIYVLSPWLNSVNYQLPIWANVLGIAALMLSLWLFWRSHHDLGKNWSSTLQIREGHTLTTNGVYQNIRHPMYASVLLLCVAQALLLPNWIAGLSGFIGFSIAYATRVNQEEQMLLDRFGDEYEAYRQSTKRLVPYLF